MPTFNTHRQVKHTDTQMFNLVSDVEHYPEFLPMCEALVIRSREERQGKTLLKADMTVGYKMIRETFTTQVLLDPDRHMIDVRYIDGPFRYLENRWSFSPLNDGEFCDVEFYIDYEFKSRMLGMLMGTMFDIAFKRFTEAFEMRADKIYGQHDHS